MATSSFNKDFTITKIETVERLEKSIEQIKPLAVSTKDAISEIKRSESKLLSILRAKA